MVVLCRHGVVRCQSLFNCFLLLLLPFSDISLLEQMTDANVII